MYFTIIIINYNLTKEVKACISSLLNYSKNNDYEIILVDNHSEDESIVLIAEEFSKSLSSKFKFIRTDRNLGFGNACNLAAKESNGDILFFLNPDTIINDDIFPHLYYKTKEYKGIWGLNVNGNKFMDFSAGLFPNFWLETLNIFFLGRYLEAAYIKLKSMVSADKKLNLQWVMGAALLINRDLFDKVKGFDPDYFLYYEEMDLCKRIINKGFPVTYLSSIKIEHIGSAISKKNYYFFTKMFYKGKLLFLKKHNSGSRFNLYKILIFLSIQNQMFLWRILKYRDNEKSGGKIKAFRELLANINEPEKISNFNYNK